MVNFLLRTCSPTRRPTTGSRAVAGGAERVGDIALWVGVDSTTANKYLHVLHLRLVDASGFPSRIPTRCARGAGAYRIADHSSSRSSFRHLARTTTSRLVEAGRGERVLD